MEDKFLFSLMVIPFIIWGILSIKYPEFMYKTAGINTAKKKPSRDTIIRYKIGGFVMLTTSIILIIIIFSGGFGF